MAVSDAFQTDPHLELQANRRDIDALMGAIGGTLRTMDEAAKRIIANQIIAHLDTLLCKPEPFVPARGFGYGCEDGGRR